MGLEIVEPAHEGLEVFLAQLRHGDAAVILERARGGHDHGAVGHEAGQPALDVEELLRPEVGGEARLREADVAELEGQARGHH